MGTPRLEAAGAPSRCEVGSAVSRWATLGRNRWATLGRKGTAAWAREESKRRRRLRVNRLRARRGRWSSVTPRRDAGRSDLRRGGRSPGDHSPRAARRDTGGRAAKPALCSPADTVGRQLPRTWGEGDRITVRARGGAGDGAPTVACLPPLGDARLDGRRPDGRLVPLTGAHVRWASQQSVTSTATTCHRKPARSVRQSRRLPDGDRSPSGVDPSHRERVLVVVDSCEHRTPTARGTAAGQSAGTSRDHAGVLTPLSSVSCPDRTAAGRRPSERASAQGRAARGRAFPTAARTPSMPGRAHQT
jgi:hypothetical protein